MKTKRNHFNSKELLPHHIVITSAGTHLYRIGLSLFPTQLSKRNRLHNPINAFILNIFVFIRCIICLSLPNSRDDILLIIGDFSYIYDLKIHWNTFIIVVGLLVFIYQMIHYYNFKNDIKPEYLKPFEMISGLVSPQSIGLTNESDIHKIMRMSRISFKLCNLATKVVMPLVAFTISITAFSLKCNVKQLIVFAIPHSLLLAYYCYITYSIVLWQLIYFHLICFYLKCKIKTLNQKIKTNCSHRRRIRNSETTIILKSLTSVYSETIQYNNNYWYKFLFWFWALFSLMVNTFLYSTIYGNLNFIVKSIFIVGTISLICAQLLVTNTASSVNNEANKSYKLLNSLVISLNRKQMNNRTLLKVLIK